MPLIKTIISCGQNNMSRVEHRSDGKFVPDSVVTEEQKLFCSPLAFMLDFGDKALHVHLKSCEKMLF